MPTSCAKALPSAVRNTARQVHSSSSKKEWLVILPDKPGVLDHRIKIRPKHSPNFVRLHNEGWVSWAGPMFDKAVPKDDPRRPFRGSVMVVNEENPEAIKKKLSEDVFVRDGIWDMDKAQFIPFRTLKRAPV